MKLGAKVKFAVDYEEHKGKPFAASWELVDGPVLESRSRSRGPRTRGSPSYGRGDVRRRRRSSSHDTRQKTASRERRRSPSCNRARDKTRSLKHDTKGSRSQRSRSASSAK